VLQGGDEREPDRLAADRHVGRIALERDEAASLRLSIPDGKRVKVKEGKGAFGYNAATDTYEDLIEAGVIDPTKVVRSALQNAASVAGLMLTTETVIAEKPKRDSGGMPQMPGGGMDY